jgi:hypothetical protein
MRRSGGGSYREGPDPAGRGAVVPPTEGIEEISLSKVMVAGIRLKGKYAESGKMFAKLGKSLVGPPSLTRPEI